MLPILQSTQARDPVCGMLVDPERAALSPEAWALTSEACRRFGRLIDTMCEVRATMTESRILLARSQRRPQLVSNNGA